MLLLEVAFWLLLSGNKKASVYLYTKCYSHLSISFLNVDLNKAQHFSVKEKNRIGNSAFSTYFHLSYGALKENINYRRGENGNCCWSKSQAQPHSIIPMSVFSFSSLLPLTISYPLSISLPDYPLSFLPPLFLSISPFFIFLTTPLCDFTFRCIQITEKSLVRSNSLEMWGFLLNYAICFFIPDGLVGLAFNIFIHVLQRQEERGWIKVHVMVWGEEKYRGSVRETNSISFISNLKQMLTSAKD